MRRLYQQIYATILLALLLVVVVAGGIWRQVFSKPLTDQAIEVVGVLAAAALPAANAPREVQARAIHDLSDRLRADLALYGSNREPIAATATALELGDADGRGGLMRGRHGHRVALRLPDDRWIVARARERHRRPAMGLITFLAAVALLVGLSAYPLVRRLTGRLERLQAGVENLGSGDLSSRVEVEGRDEVARLATSFNSAAERIEELVSAHRRLLANASHELRTPLSRIRMNAELLKGDADAKRKAELARDISELDDLIEEILLASRLEALDRPQVSEPLDLLALAAEESVHYDDCTLTGDRAIVIGDPRLLRRLVRNLLENARRHGRPPITVSVQRDASAAVLEVRDGGDGVPPEERERVFAPFYRVGRGGDPGGSGLGLALVRQIARHHGGDAVLVSTPAAPSCVRVTLPLLAVSTS